MFSLICTYITKFLTYSNFEFMCICNLYYSFVLFFIYFFASRFGVICAFTTNEVLEEGVKDLPKHVRTSMIDTEMYINNTKKVNICLIKLSQFSFIGVFFFDPTRGLQPLNSLEQIKEDSDANGIFFFPPERLHVIRYTYLYNTCLFYVCSPALPRNTCIVYSVKLVVSARALFSSKECT